MPGQRAAAGVCKPDFGAPSRVPVITLPEVLRCASDIAIAAFDRSYKDESNAECRVLVFTSDTYGGGLCVRLSMPQEQIRVDVVYSVVPHNLLYDTRVVGEAAAILDRWFRGLFFRRDLAELVNHYYLLGSTEGKFKRKNTGIVPIFARPNTQKVIALLKEQW